METWYDKYNHFMVDLRDPRYVSSCKRRSLIPNQFHPNFISQFLSQDGQLLHDVLGLADCGYLHSLRLHLQSVGTVVRIKLILCKNCGHFAQHFRIINSNYEISLDWWLQFLSQVYEKQGAVWHQAHHHCLQLVPDRFQLLGLLRGLEVWLCWNDKTGICLKVSLLRRFYVTGDYNWTCQPIDYSNHPEALRALNMAWLFYMSKFLDMFDSFFFVAKKKNTHLSFLHVYHHGIMPLECWFGAK